MINNDMESSIQQFSQKPLRFLFVFPYIILLIASVTLPSDGSHGIFSVKSLAFIGSVFSLSLYLFINNNISRSIHYLLVFVLASVSFILFTALEANVDDPYSLHSTIDQFKIMSLTVGMIGLTLFVVNESLLTYSSFVKIILNFNLAFSIFKILLVILFLLKFLDPVSFLKLLGIQYMSMSIIGDLSRLQTSMDIATPFLVLFLLESSALQIPISRKFKFIYLTFSLISVILSFSRYLFFIFLCSVALYWLTLSFRKMLPRVILSLGLLLVACTWLGWDKIYTAVEVRFFSEAVDDSDSVRGQQIRALMHDFYENPYLGKGLGGYSSEVIRDVDNPHSYEVQWVAFLMQFGIIGLLLLMVPVAIVTLQYLTLPLSAVKIAFLLLFYLWILSGFTNPFLISLASGMMYSLFTLTASRLKTLNSK